MAAGSGTGGSASATGGVDLLFSGTVLSRSNNINTALIKQGNGVMELTGANIITPVQVNAGILQINSIANGGVQTTATAATGSTSVTVAGARRVSRRARPLASTPSIPMSTLEPPLGAATQGSTTVPLAIPTNTTDTGTTGAVNTTLTFGFANPLGISTNAASNFVLDGGTLQYTGAAASTDRLFTVGAAEAGCTCTLDASGTGALNFTNTGAIAYGTTGQTRTLGLTGTNTGANTLAPSIANNGAGAVSLTKTGVGSWTLTGNNTYTGTTTVSGGILTAAGDQRKQSVGWHHEHPREQWRHAAPRRGQPGDAAAAITLGTTAAQTPASTTGS